MKKNSDYPKWKLFLDLGKEQLKSAKYDLAISSFNKTIKLKTKNKYNLYFLRGIAKYSWGINNFGCARCNLDNYQLGINDFAEAKKLDKDLIFEDINYGYCKFKLINELPKEMKYFLGKNLHTFLKEI